MKKIFTLMAASALGATSLMAAPFNPAVLEDVTAKFTPEGLQKVRTNFADMKVNGVEGENSLTRSWTDNQGGVWNLMLTTRGQKLCETLTFKDKDGKEFQYTFPEYPFYEADLSLSYTPKGQSQVTRYGYFVLAWPSQYIYSQGGVDMPESEINTDIVSADELINNAGMLRNFVQNQSVINVDQSGNSLASWTILPSDILGIESEWDGLIMYSQNGSSIDFQAYDPSETFIQTQTRITLKQDPNEGTRSAALRITYSGTGRVEGFEHVEEMLPNFGNIYLFNTGLVSSDILGDDKGFTENFPEMTKFYFYCGDEKLGIQVDEEGAFNESKVYHTGVDVPEGELLEHAQIFYGYLFGEPKYAKDSQLKPTEGIFNVRYPWTAYDESTDKYYLAEAPEINSFVPMGFTASWSKDSGTILIAHNNAELTGEGSSIAWGTTDGFKMEWATIYDKVLRAVAPNSTVYYYYDPKNLANKYEFSVKGDLKWDAVEEVAAAAEANVVARDGQIAVTTAEKAPIAVYTLDGKLVKAAEGTSLNVEAAKGVYVVRVANKAQKVVL
ncbi:MAG: hypothetical protein K2G78_02025 [Muribaculaceae bacterium]|nr:hypothetical protein [Muribaculaceae bacterium]